MPVTGIRCTMIMREGRFGFSETWIIQKPNIAAAQPFFIQLFKLRMALTAPPVIPFRGRMSVIGTKRATRPLSPVDLASVGVGQPTGLPSNNPNADQAKVALLSRAWAGDVANKAVYLTGIPDALIVENPEGPAIAINGTWQAAFDAYAAYIVANSWGFAGREDVAGNFVRYQVISSDLDENGFFRFVLAGAAAAGWAVGSRIQLSGFVMANRAYRSPNGIYQIDSITANSPDTGFTRYVLRASQGIIASQIRDQGTAQLVGFTNRTVTQMSPLQQTTRKRGNRSLASPGRRIRPARVSS